jgi:hypothetical protein
VSDTGLEDEVRAEGGFPDDGDGGDGELLAGKAKKGKKGEKGDITKYWRKLGNIDKIQILKSGKAVCPDLANVFGI